MKKTALVLILISVLGPLTALPICPVDCPGSGGGICGACKKTNDKNTHVIYREQITAYLWRITLEDGSSMAGMAPFLLPPEGVIFSWTPLTFSSDLHKPEQMGHHRFYWWLDEENVYHTSEFTPPEAMSFFWYPDIR